MENGLRAGDVIKGIRSLVRKTPREKERLNINETIREVFALAASELTRNYERGRLPGAGIGDPISGE